MNSNGSLEPACSLGIAELLENYRRGTLSPVAVAKDALARAEATNDALNTFVTIAHDTALAQAAEAQAAYRAGKDPGPLGGVPVSIKDIIPTQGLRTTFGSASARENIPARDALSVQRWKQSGAVVIGKTATPEFACRQTTSSSVSGVTRNPWNPALTPGGSSGGSSASLAAGIGHLSLVTDGGGSSRLPAACTAVVGFKPTFGKIPYDTALDAFGGLAHIGIMGRRAGDVAIGLAAAAGPCPADPYSLLVANRLDVRRPRPADLPLQGLRIGLRERHADEPVDEHILASIRGLAKVMEHLGAVVAPLRGEIEAPLPTWRVLQHAIWAQRYGASPPTAQTDPVIMAGIEHARALSASDLQAAMHGRTRLFRQAQAWFDEIDVVLSPTLTRDPIAADHPGHGTIETADGSHADIRSHWAPLLGLFTMTGHPSVSFNCGWTRSGLPIGAHLASRWHSDEALLGIVAAVEQAMPEAAWRMPPV
ncbi:MAG: amidase [Candidimonas sp.]